MSTFNDIIDSLFKTKHDIARQKEIEQQVERDKQQRREYIRQQDDNSLMGQPMAIIGGVEEANTAGQGSLLARARAIEAVEREKAKTAQTETADSEETESFLHKPAVENDFFTYSPRGPSFPHYIDDGYVGDGYDYSGHDVDMSYGSGGDVGCGSGCDSGVM